MTPSPPAPAVVAYLAALRAAGFRGDLADDAGARIVAATDNSIYEVLPDAVIAPRDADDAALALGVAHRSEHRAVPLRARGGGTGTNGQALGDGVVIDLHRHCTGIAIDPRARTAWVGAGVVRDELNRAARAHGLFFAPDLSTSNRATLGGMIATDACGQGSRVHGKTSEHVVALDLVLDDGTRWTCGRITPDEERALAARDDRVGALVRATAAAVDAHRAEARAAFPGLTRFFAGYNLARARADDGALEPHWLLCGAEGTLALVVGATVRLTPLPARTTLVAIAYAGFAAALAHARTLIAADPSAIETVDERILGLARGDALWPAVAPLLPDGDYAALNLVEFAGEPERVAAAVAALRAGLAGHGVVGSTVAERREDVAALWALRKQGVGLLGATPGRRKPVPFIEDVAVPPERLADAVAEMRALLDAHGLGYGMFGHVDAGCLHVRPALDLADPADEARLRAISDGVAAIARRHGGVLWGEHGKGFRSEYMPFFLGDRLADAMRAVKAAFDPANRLNPGKLAAPAGCTAPLPRLDQVPLRGHADRRTPAAEREALSWAFACNGNAHCHDWDPDQIMCPTWKATRDPVHGPKGRAMLARAYAQEAGDPPARGLVARVVATLRAPEPVAAATVAALDGCTACKACAHACPVHVDVPELRARVLERHHRGRLRPWRDHLFAAVEDLLPLAARAPRLANIALRNPLSRWLGSAMLGVDDPPALSVPSLAHRLRARPLLRTPQALTALPPPERERAVVLVPDAFTAFCDAAVVTAFVAVAAALGVRVALAPFAPGGKALHVKGFRARHATTAARAAAVLAPWAATGATLVCIEPAAALTWRDDLPRALGRDDLPRPLTPQEWLAREAALGRFTAPPARRRMDWRLLGHCTERVAVPGSDALWQRAFAALGLRLAPVPAGCCGMAGLWGHETHHRTTSAAIFAQSWGPALARVRADGGEPLATGWSCRSQAARFADQRIRHPLQALQAELVAEGH